MSTLNSSQLYVKRSSTRLHAPPGGHSSLSFGSGGFGTTDPAVADTAKQGHVDPAELLPPSSAGSFRSNSTGVYGAYNHPANNQSSDGTYSAYGSGAAPPTAFHSIKGYASASGQGPPASSHGYAANSSYAAAPSAAYLPAHSTESRPASTQSNFSWGERGSQPPLTSSKRDQNWEKKRRLWLARKHGSGGSSGGRATPPGAPVASYGQLPPPPATAYAGAGAYYEPAYNPPSPLTKFMAQQNQPNPPFTPQTNTSGGYDASQVSPPTSYGGRPPSSSGFGGEYPPPRTASGYRDELLPPPGTAYSSGHGVRQGLTSSAGGGYAPASTTHAYYAPPRTSMPGTAFSTASSSHSSGSRRQPPGGSSNWNPYS